MGERVQRKSAADGSSRSSRSIWKGLFAGLIAGVSATAAKAVAEKFYPPRIHGKPEPTEALAVNLAGHELSPASKHSAGRALNWGIGAAAGAAYGVAAEYFPEATHKDGASFGLLLMAITHENGRPTSGVQLDETAHTVREETSETASHILFGVVAERVRRVVRGMLR